MDDVRAVDDAIAKLESFHAIGRETLDAYRDRLPHGVAPVLAERHGMHPEILRSARRFASPARDGYSRKDLDRLVGRMRRYRFALHRSHLIKLLTVRDRDERSRLELDVIQGRWSRRQLDFELRLRRGKLMHAGRRPRQVATSEEAALSVLRAAETLLRVFAQFGVGDSLKAEDVDVPAPPELEREMQRCHETLQELVQRARRTVSERRDIKP
jgi:hypothetical protein